MNDRIIELKNQIEIWEKFNNNGILDKQISKAKIEIEVLLKEIQDEENEVNASEEDDEKDLILCSHKDLIHKTTNKQYNSYSYGIAMGYVDTERINGEMNKYLYKKDIEKRREELLLEGIQVASVRVLERDFKFLSDLGYVDIINTKKHGLCYILKQTVDSKYFVTISYYRWRKLVNWTNKAMLKLYIAFVIKCNCYEYTLITRSYLCEHMGIKVTEGNVRYISELIQGLKRLGAIVIDKRHEVIKYQDDEGNFKYKNVTYNYYRLTTDKEFKEKQ